MFLKTRIKTKVQNDLWVISVWYFLKNVITATSDMYLMSVNDITLQVPWNIIVGKIIIELVVNDK